MADLSSKTIEELDAIITEATKIREGKVEARRSELLAELEKLGGKVPTRRATTDKRNAPAPKYQSKKDASVTWSGRGAMAGWMKAEIEAGLGKTKEDFLIKPE